MTTYSTCPGFSAMDSSQRALAMMSLSLGKTMRSSNFTNKFKPLRNMSMMIRTRSEPSLRVLTIAASLLTNTSLQVAYPASQSSSLVVKPAATSLSNSAMTFSECSLIDL